MGKVSWNRTGGEFVIWISEAQNKTPPAQDGQYPSLAGPEDLSYTEACFKISLVKSSITIQVFDVYIQISF